MEISLDKLPIKRLDVIEENGLERFPPYGSSYPHSLPSFWFIFLATEQELWF